MSNLNPFFIQERFTQDTQPHYIYSPREMTRWVRGIFEALRPLESLPVEGLIRIWAHEALRLFQDRSVQVSAERADKSDKVPVSTVKKTKKTEVYYKFGLSFHHFFRLVGDEERRWTDENIDMVALKHFPNIDKEKALNRPILYSNWLSKVN